MSVERVVTEPAPALATPTFVERWLPRLEATSPAFAARVQKLYAMRVRLASFALSGVAGALTQLVLLSVLTTVGWSHLIANGVAVLMSMQVNFWFNLRFTWRDRAEDITPRGLVVRWARFHGAVAGTAVLNMVVFALLSPVLPHLIAACLGIGLASVANYFTGDRFVFRSRSAPVTAPSDEPEPSTPLVSAETSSGSSPLSVTESAPASTRPMPWWRDSSEPDMPASGPRGRWAALAPIAVIGLAAFMFIWGLARSGYSNEYYAAAVFSMTKHLDTFFFASLDPGGYITVDKPPFALWVQAISARLFGLSPWSILLPQALAGVLTITALYLMTHRVFGTLAGLAAALILTLTPITVAINRVNLPDAMLVLLLVLGAWGIVEAVRTGRLLPLLLGVAMVGLGFNTKMLQAFVVAPAFFGTYLLAGPVSFWRRIVHLTAAGIVLLAVAGSWMLVVDAIPADERPYIGGSQSNSVLDLALGYNGVGRIFGERVSLASLASTLLANSASSTRDDSSPDAGPNGGAVLNGGPAGGGRAFGGLGGGPGFGGVPGWQRLFNEQIGGQISWLLPLAALSFVAGVLARGRRPRTDLARAWYLLWGGWLATHFVVFSFAEGIFHPYYTSAMAPSIAALCGAGLVALWDWYRRSVWTSWLLPAAFAATAAWAVVLLGRSAWLPWLTPVVIGCVAMAALGLLAARLMTRPSGRRIASAAMVAGLVGVLAGPAAWASTPLLGGPMAVNPQAGPADALRGFGPFGGGGRGFRGGGPGGPNGQVSADGPPGVNGQVGGPQFPGRGAGPFGGRGFAGGPVGPDGAVAPGGPGLPGVALAPGDGVGVAGAPQPPAPADGPSNRTGPAGFAPGGGPFGGPGQFGRQNDAALIAYLEANRGSAEYLVAATGSMSAAPLMLATQAPVISIGGFTGADPAPTSDQLEDLVREGKLRFVLLGGRGGGPGPNVGEAPNGGQGPTIVPGSGRGFGPGGFGRNSERTSWVETACVPVDPAAYGGESTGEGGTFGRGGGQLYDCAPASQPASASLPG